MRTGKILIPLDGSEMAEAAIGEAQQLVGPDSKLILVRAASARSLPGTDVVDTQLGALREAEATCYPRRRGSRAKACAASRRTPGTGPPLRQSSTPRGSTRST